MTRTAQRVGLNRTPFNKKLNINKNECVLPIGEDASLLTILADSSVSRRFRLRKRELFLADRLRGHDSFSQLAFCLRFRYSFLRI